MQNVCAECGISGDWNGKPLTLQLDHINGKHSDNRIENLRILCPNCHSQTSTWGMKVEKVIRLCSKCQNPIHRKNISGVCRNCILRINQDPHRKVENRPDCDTLKFLIERDNLSGVGRSYGVSGNAVKKWLKSCKDNT